MNAKKESPNTEITLLTEQISELTSEIRRLNALVVILQKRIEFDQASRRRMDELAIGQAIEAAELRRKLAAKDAENRP
jgi:hypothetical protein